MAINGITIQPTSEPPAPRQGGRSGVRAPDSAPVLPSDAAVDQSTRQAPESPQIEAPRASLQRAAQAIESQSSKSLEQLAAQVSEKLTQIEKHSIGFHLHEDIGRTVVSVVDLETQEVIRQIPSEALVRIAEVLNEINSQREGGNESIESTGLLIQDSV